MVPECKTEWNRELITVFSRLPSLRRLQATPTLQTSLLLGKFQLSGFDPNAETLILTECSTTYIHADQCENLLNMLTNYLKKFAYISYEQIRKEVLIFF